MKRIAIENITGLLPQTFRPEKQLLCQLAPLDLPYLFFGIGNFGQFIISLSLLSVFVFNVITFYECYDISAFDPVCVR